MRKVLIVGEDSYIGESFSTFARDKYYIKSVSSLDGAWEHEDFTGYDSILHCAGIAHVSHDAGMESLYYAVNCDLAIALAEKAKTEGAKQFIFLSSMLVYGSTGTEISTDTSPNPDSGDFYSLSKFKAEQELQKLADDNFNLCIVRPPMVYGPGCKGNFPRLVNLAKKITVFPNFSNRRSMIYIENLCSFFCKLIDEESHGVFTPQNSEYVSTTNLVQCIAEHEGKRMRTTKLFNPLINLLKKRISAIGKMFGNLTYTKTGDEDSYNVVTFEESIKKSIQRPEPSLSSKRVPPQGRVICSTSIITVTYNSEKTLKDTLESVLNQTMPPTEYIIVDGVSTDSTIEIAESYRNAFENRGIKYKIISEPDNGIYDAMNKGILASTGDIIGMINSDDWYEPQAAQRAIETYVSKNYDMMFADIIIHKNGRTLTKKAKRGKWVTSRTWNHPTTFTHKSVYKENLFPLNSIYDDFDLYIKLHKENKNIVVINEVLANYRLGGASNQKGFSAAWKRMKTRYSIYRKHGYSRIYILECFFIEGAKFLLT